MTWLDQNLAKTWPLREETGRSSEKPGSNSAIEICWVSGRSAAANGAQQLSSLAKAAKWQRLCLYDKWFSGSVVQFNRNLGPS